MSVANLGNFLWGGVNFFVGGGRNVHQDAPALVPYTHLLHVMRVGSEDHVG